jgi:hypothetical protein
MAAAKRRTRTRKQKSLQPTGRSMPALSTAARSLFNMTVTAVTSGSVLLCLFAAKRWL